MLHITVLVKFISSDRKAHQMSGEVTEPMMRNQHERLEAYKKRDGVHCQANVDEKVAAAASDECCCCWGEEDGNLS